MIMELTLIRWIQDEGWWVSHTKGTSGEDSKLSGG